MVINDSVVNNVQYIMQNNFFLATRAQRIDQVCNIPAANQSQQTFTKVETVTISIYHITKSTL
jgi:hypothetical protein